LATKALDEAHQTPPPLSRLDASPEFRVAPCVKVKPTSEAPFVSQAHRLGIKVPFLGSDAWSTEELVNMCGKECEGFYLFNHYSPETTNPDTIKFIGNYKAAYSVVPDDVAALSYDALGVLSRAIASAGKLDRQAVRDAMSTLAVYNGVTGSIKYTPGSGDPIKGGVILQIRDGKFKWYADAKP